MFCSRRAGGHGLFLSNLKATAEVNKEASRRLSCGGRKQGNALQHLKPISSVCRGNADGYMSVLVNRSDSSTWMKETDTSWFNGAPAEQKVLTWWHPRTWRDKRNIASVTPQRPYPTQVRPRESREVNTTRPSARWTLIKIKCLGPKNYERPVEGGMCC